ncbi:MAG: formylglycine-generating enzyme family protein [Polyangiales bacterium]
MIRVDGGPRGHARKVLVAACAAASYANGCSSSLPPLGEAVIVLDTDVSVPRYVSDLRIDVFDAGGTWLDSRDVVTPSTLDWPVSFSVVDPSATDPATLWVRVRGYPEGHVRDYRGDHGDTTDSPEPADHGPRLVVEGVDVTPADEPEPGVSIDRFIRVDLVPGTRGSTVVTLRGECLGFRADLATLRSCIDTAGTAVSPAAEALGPLTRSAPALFGTWSGEQSVACNGAPTPGEVCIPGGAFFQGDMLAGGAGATRSQPERARVMPPMFLSAHEVTVGEFRAALHAGLSAPALPVRNDQALALPADAFTGAGVDPGVPTLCTWNGDASGPVASIPSREDMPLTCVPWATARAYCRSLGGDLPREDAWEWAATAQGRNTETLYPWGDDVPTNCDVTVFARYFYFAVQVNSVCATDASGAALVGPATVGAAPWVASDASPAGVSGLAGNVAELMVDSFVSYDDPLRARLGLRAELPIVAAPTQAALRGTGWEFGLSLAIGSARNQIPLGDASETNPGIGFRCARPAN